MYRLNIKALKQFLPFLILCMGLFAVSCGDDESDPEPLPDCTGVDPSYMTDITPIINTSCALSGCHEPNFPFGDFTSYDGLKEKADDGSLRAQAVVDKSMPPETTTGPTELTTAQIQLIFCWIEDGAPNN